MTTEFTRRDVPADEVDGVVRLFEDDGCTVETFEQDDGLWTVIATCPDASDSS